MVHSFQAFSLTVLIVFSQIGFASDMVNDTTQSGNSFNETAVWEKQCARVRNTEPPKSDLPSAQLAASFAGCDAATLYYETKGRQSSDLDWKKVRDCAFTEYDSSVLMMLYANGLSVQKNVGLATKYACELDGAPYEMAVRISHLSSMSNDRDEPLFDLCDHVTSGFLGGVCAYYSAHQKTIERNERLAKLTSHWPSPHKEAYTKLTVAVSEFSDLVSSKETDGSGSGRAAFMIDAAEAEMDLFAEDIQDFENGATPQYSAKQFHEYDRILNQRYKELMHSKPLTEWPTRLGFTTIAKEGVRETQRSWLKYRDAWDDFAHLRYPSLPPNSLKALLTKRRIETLDTLLEVAREGL